MGIKALIINEFDLSLKDGIQVDIDLCRFFRVECQPLITTVTRERNALLETNPREIINQLRTFNIDRFNTLKLDISTGIEVIEYIGSYLRSFKSRILTFNTKLAGKNLTHEYLNSLSKTEVLNKSDLLFITSEDVENLSNILGIALKSPNELIDLLSKSLNVTRIMLVNHREGNSYLSITRLSEEEYLEFKTSTYLPKDLISTYVMIDLTMGADLKESLRNALDFARKSIEYGVENFGSVIPEVYASSILDAERYRVINELSHAVSVIEENSHLIINLIPEVQMNIAYSLPKHLLRSLGDVAAIPGRIAKVGNSVKALSHPEFGASKHLARALMKVMEYDPKFRSIANIRFNDSILKAVEKLGYTISSYDRTLEPPEVKYVEGATIPWGVGEAIKKAGFVPDVIYHKGDYGKEAMIAILGQNPNDVVRKLLKIGEVLKELAE
ncbi:MAG: thiamine-phosphate synthase family protein [Sulfolobales archaeon]|nr:hypothetical protein [Sulfolobales archaeon]MCX8186477.1 hypothetical protein [Sulfolobales archaeon]MDW7969807.1 thiamine-phosphate synthase family protein [Sulfolobales archaeon]